MMILHRMLTATLFVMFFALTEDIHAQEGSDPTNMHLFVKIDGLSPDSYAQAVKAVRASGIADVGMACIPTELIRIDVTEIDSSAYEAVKAELKTAIQEATAHEVTFMDAMQQESFENACANARFGLQNN